MGRGYGSDREGKRREKGKKRTKSTLREKRYFTLLIKGDSGEEEGMLVRGFVGSSGFSCFLFWFLLTVLNVKQNFKERRERERDKEGEGGYTKNVKAAMSPSGMTKIARK